MREGSTISSLSSYSVTIEMSERLKVEVSLPLHRFEMEDTAFMDRVCQALRGLSLMSQIGMSMHGMWDNLMKQVQTACAGMENLPIIRRVYVTMRYSQPQCVLEGCIHFRDDGLPEKLLREDDTRETLMQHWIDFRQRTISKVLNDATTKQ